MKRIMLSLSALGLVVLGLSGIVPDFLSRAGMHGVVSAANQNILTFDVACDCRTGVGGAEPGRPVHHQRQDLSCRDAPLGSRHQRSNPPGQRCRPHRHLDLPRPEFFPIPACHRLCVQCITVRLLRLAFRPERRRRVKRRRLSHLTCWGDVRVVGDGWHRRLQRRQRSDQSHRLRH